MKRGLTLIEMMVATAVLAISFSALVGAFISARYSIALAENRMGAVGEARGRMEELLTLSYNQLSLGTHAFSNGVYTVTANDEFPDSVKDIAVTINWLNPGRTTTSSISLHGSISCELHR